MTSETLKWLSQRVPRFAALTATEQAHLSDFLILWSLFEGTELSTRGNIQAIRRYVSDLERNSNWER